MIRPVNTPITNLCTSLTTLTWNDVHNAALLSDALVALDNSITTHLNGQDFTFVSFVASEVRVQIIREARDKNIPLPSYLQFPRFFDLKTEYSKWFKAHPELPHHVPITINSICKAFDLEPLPSSTTQINTRNSSQIMTITPHRAYEEAIVLSSILISMIRKSQPIERYPEILAHPVDLEADMSVFIQEQSTVLFLSNLPHDTTQGELESWFTQYGGRPSELLTLRIPDQYKPMGTGFAIFPSHEEAKKCMMFNGRCLNERVIEVLPSSTSVLERAGDILIHFPQSKNRPRPGDWNCPNCGFSNFQRRTACFRCTYPLHGNNDRISSNNTTNNNNTNNKGNSKNSNNSTMNNHNLIQSSSNNFNDNSLNSSTGNSNFQQQVKKSTNSNNNSRIGVNNSNNVNIVNSSTNNSSTSSLGRSNTNSHNNNANEYKVSFNGNPLSNDNIETGKSRILRNNSENDSDNSIRGSNASPVMDTSNYNINLNNFNPVNNNNTYEINSTIGNNNEKSNNENNHRQNNNQGQQNSVPFRAGDWKCTSDGCNYHNFAKNLTCLRCGATRKDGSNNEKNYSMLRKSNSLHNTKHRNLQRHSSLPAHSHSTSYSQQQNIPSVPQLPPSYRHYG